MKKAIKLTMGAVIATSALTPVAALAADVTKTAAKDGFYNITTGDFYTSAEFKALPKADQKALIKNVDVHLVFKGTVYKGMDIALLSSTELATAGVKEEAFEAANNNIDLTADGKVLDKDGKDLKDETTTTDFIVESVSAIESTIVEVTFPELTVALTDATVEVKDDKGVVREVVARDIAKGATKAQFDFKTAVKADELTGVWTVNGVSYSFVELKMVTDIVTESGKSPVNQVKVYNLLKDAGIKNVDADLIETYASDITGADATPILASDIQKIVDQTNKDAGKVANEATVVKAVADATNQIQLLPVLEANFDRVNPDWIADYATATVAAQGPMIDLDKANYLGVTGTGVTVADIQTTIDTANSTLNQSTGALNAGKIATLNTAADTTVKQAEVTSLIEKYIKADDPKAPTVTPKAKAIAASKAKEAAFRVAEATTENSLYNALVAYAGVTSDATLKVSELNSSLKTFYKDSFDTLTKDQLITDIKGNVSDIKGDIVTAADSDAVDIALDNVGITATAYAGAPTDATKKAAFSKALQTLANYTSHEALSANKFNLATIDNVVLDSYATALTAIDNTDAVSDVQTAVKTVNDNKALVAAVKVVGDANSTTMQVRDALVTLAVAESGNATATAFVNATSQQKLEAAQFIVDNNDLLADPITKSSIVTHGTPTAGDDAYNTTALSQALADHAAKVGEFNAIGNLATPQTTASTKGHLDTYAYAPYKALSAVQKLAVAEEINKLTKPTSATDATPVALNFAGTDAVKTLKAANDIIDAAITRVAE